MIFKKFLFALTLTAIISCSNQKDGLPSIPNTGGNDNINIQLDGQKSESEWKEAGINRIQINDEWTIAVHFMQDQDHLYFAFSNLKLNDSTEIYPEVLIDSKNNKTESWDKNDWWFHTSYSNCQNKGKFNDYDFCEIGQKEGWIGKNFPLMVNEVVEIRIRKDLLNVTFGDKIGIAFDVTDTQEKWSFYPESASLERPETWMTMTL